jgi:selenide,water dikinase
MQSVKLTQFSSAAGCGCKLSPEVLSEILKDVATTTSHSDLLVGNDKRDDAAAVDLGDGRALLSTTDFFTPIVDDAYDFGRIAAANAISDIYAMGGVPTVAIAILGWPVDHLAPSIAGEVLSGARAICQQAGIALAGGHSINAKEPIFGLAVSGLVAIEHLKQNSSARAGDTLFLTKPLGAGIISTAVKRAKAIDADLQASIDQMTKLNDIGSELAAVAGVNAMTDVTGFGLAGHLIEMIEGASLDAAINWGAVPKHNNLDFYISENCLPGGTSRNIRAAGAAIAGLEESVLPVLCDPQTSGGLLIAVSSEATAEVAALLRAKALPYNPIGYLSDRKLANSSLSLLP